MWDDNISRLEYRDDLNLIRFDYNYANQKPSSNLMGRNSNRIHSFYEKHGQKVSIEFAKNFIDEIIPESDNYLHLISFFVLSRFRVRYDNYHRGLNIIIFPKEEYVKSYKIKEDKDLFSNIHMKNCDPLILRNINLNEKIILGSNDRTSYVKISGAILFTENPWRNAKKYEYFRHFIDNRREVTDKKYQNHSSVDVNF